MTGAEILREFNRNIFKAYSDYYNNVKMNDLFKRSLVAVIEDTYDNLIEQKAFDNISAVIKLNQVFSVNNNQINTFMLDIIDITHPSDFVLVTRTKHNMSVGDSFEIANVAGFTTPVNGVRVVTAVNSDFSIGFAATFTGGAYTANTGQIISHTLSGIPKMISDYNNLLSIKAKYEQVLSYKVVSIENTQPIKITLNTINNNLASRELINISGVLGNTNANGDRYVSKINRKTFGIYYDKDLTNSTYGNGSFQGLPTLKRIFYNYATPLISTEKIESYEYPTLHNPKFERGDKMIKIAPYNFTCTEITVDYISNAVVFFDVADSVIDLTNTYPLEFIYQVINRAVFIFQDEVKRMNKSLTPEAQNKP